MRRKLQFMRREVFMRDKAANIVLMLILNMMVIGTLVRKSRGGKAIDFSTSDGIITMLFLVAMAAVDVLYTVKLIRGSGK
jgi:hypothetical protein